MAYGGDFATRSELISNNFQDFLRENDLEFLEKNPGAPDDKRCDFYKNSVTGLSFLHDFPVGVPLEQSFSSIQSKYNRRIERLYANIHKAKTVLLVWVNPDGITDSKVIVAECARICKKFGRKIDFLLVEHDESTARGAIKIEQLAKNIVRHKLFVEISWEGGEIVNLSGEVECNSIFAEYYLDQSIGKRTQKLLLHLGTRVLCVFVPMKKWRKRLRSMIKEL